jgi:hypothetical protein
MSLNESISGAALLPMLLSSESRVPGIKKGGADEFPEHGRPSQS